MKLFFPAAIFLASLGCGSSGPTASERAAAPAVPSPTAPLVFNLDLSNPLPLVTLLATQEEFDRLKSVYTSFLIELGPPVNGAALSMRYDRKGSLQIPWRFYLRNFKPPYPVRLMGVLPDGKREVLHEEIFH